MIKKYFRVNAVLIFGLLLSIEAVYTSGERQLAEDKLFQARQIIASDSSTCNYIVETDYREYMYESRSIAEQKYGAEYRRYAPSNGEYLDVEQTIQDTCKAYVGKIKYTLGMKSTLENWTIQEGLDCSGFVEYVYIKAGFETVECIESTLTISSECQEVEHSLLRVGDLGMIYADGSYYENSDGDINYTGDFDDDGEIDKDAVIHANHVGIYLGTDEDGKDIWCHCNGKDNTVVIGEYPDFIHYYRVNIIGE